MNEYRTGTREETLKKIANLVEFLKATASVIEDGEDMEACDLTEIMSNGVEGYSRKANRLDLLSLARVIRKF